MRIQESNTHTESFPGSHISVLCNWPQAAADSYHSQVLRFDVSSYTEQHLLQTASFDHIQTTTAAAKMYIAEGKKEI